MRKICQECNWWRDDEPEEWDPLLHPVDVDTCERMVMPWVIRECKCPDILFYDRPVKRNQATVQDGSEYFARLCTGPDFGCVLFKQR